MILAPPPDLAVTSLNVSSSRLRTGDIFTVSYNVTNEGAGPTYETHWEDLIVS